MRVELAKEQTGLHPGMTVKVAFVVGDRERLLLPATALVRRSELTAVYVLADGRLALRQVRLGHRFGERVEVLAGLAAGETVVTDPLAASAALVASREPGHE